MEISRAGGARHVDLQKPPSAGWAASPRGLLMLAVILAALILSRKPGVLLHAELWGDDGWSWYPDAYNAGLASLTKPVNGYLNSFQRLVGLAVQPFPLVWVPTLFALAGLAAQLAPPLYLLSSRLDRAWPNRLTRLGFALIFAVLPNEIELYVNLTNAQWNLALLGFLVLVAAPPASRAATVFDGLALLLCGLSGPFCLLLLPVALWETCRLRDRASIWRLALLGATATVQLATLLQAPNHGALATPLGAGPLRLARVLTSQVLLGAELGYQTIAGFPGLAIWRNNMLPLAVTAGACIFGGIALLNGPRILRQFTLFAALVFAAALAHPTVSITIPQWQAMEQPPMGNRYGTMLVIAWIGMVFALACHRSIASRIAGAALLIPLLFWAIPHDWAEMRFPRTDFDARARAFEAAPAGTIMSFPINPPGLTPMFLVKRGQ